jgi:FAD/FMN-containing dehydrogenase
VRAAIEHARFSGLPLAIRGGGHNVAGTASCDGGLVVDLSLMKNVRVGPASRSAWAQAGLLWGELDQAPQTLGLATTGGVDGREHPELFWGVRGGGGNFGVVTAFQFRLHQVGPQVLAGPVLYPAEQAGQVLRRYRDWAADAPTR